MGKSCHSSNPNNGINANYILAKIINKIEELNLKFENTTLNCGIVNGGEKINIVPSYSCLQFDIRSATKKNQELAFAEIEGFISTLKNSYSGCQITLTQTLSIPALEKNINGKINNIIKKFNLIETEFVGGCEAGYFQALGGDAFLFGAGDLSLAHKPNEFLNVDNFKIYNKQFLKILNYICES